MNKQEKRNYHQSIVGSSLSKTTKMPCLSFNLSAEHCITGSKLVNVKGSVCYGCYALGGLYKVYGHIEKMKPKTDKIKNDLWVSSMVWLIENQLGNKDKSYFRWHDSGDIQNLEHLCKIVEVVNLTPAINHWLPTREYKIVQLYRDLYGEFPENLVVRLSAHMVDTQPPSGYGLPTSTVETDSSETCPSRKQDNECKDCRACWNADMINVSYSKH